MRTRRTKKVSIKCDSRSDIIFERFLVPLTTEHCIKRLSCSYLPRSLHDTSLPLPVTQRIDRILAQRWLYIGLSAFGPALKRALLPYLPLYIRLERLVCLQSFVLKPD